VCIMKLSHFRGSLHAEARLCYYVIELLGMPARESRQQVGRFWIFGE
jgi:hypothetical protein